MTTSRKNIAFATLVDAIESGEIDTVPSTATESAEIANRVGASRCKNRVRDCDERKTSFLNTGNLVNNEMSFNVEPNTHLTGNLSVQSSSDISTGSKTWFNGPVVIKRFVGDNNNPELNINQNEQCSDTSETETARNSYGRVLTYLLQHKMQLTVGIFALMTTTIVIIGQYLINRDIDTLRDTSTTTTYPTTHSSESSTSNTQNTENTTISETISTIDDYEYVMRSQYSALPPRNDPEPLIFPIKRVLIGHTVTPYCWSLETCADLIRSIQRNHIYTRGWNDISLNFLIGGDGRAYEGSGYNVGVHTIGYFYTSICISFIGDYTFHEASEMQLRAAQRFIEDGVKSHKIHSDYILYGQRQVRPLDSPGLLLYNQIKLWSHFLEEVIPL